MPCVESKYLTQRVINNHQNKAYHSRMTKHIKYISTNDCDWNTTIKPIIIGNHLLCLNCCFIVLEYLIRHGSWSIVIKRTNLILSFLGGYYEGSERTVIYYINDTGDWSIHVDCILYILDKTWMD